MQNRPEHGMTKELYTAAVLRALDTFTAREERSSKQAVPLIAKLLLSIDRRETATAALETVRCPHFMLACCAVTNSIRCDARSTG